MKNKELLDRGLPKWPQMLVAGALVTINQAKEIIRRTDTFFTLGYGGNDHDYDRKVAKLMKMPYHDIGVSPPDWEEYFNQQDAWSAKWGCVQTEYVHNDWLSCAYIYGPHGWCAPNGQIGFVDNVGKWPSCEDVFRDWQVLAKAFPFLDLGVTLCSEELGSDVPVEDVKAVVSFQVRDGQVEIVDPDERDVLAGYPIPTIDRSDSAFACFRSDSDWEHGLPWEWIEEWGETYGGH
jgi:hypothetical protein